MNLGYLMRGIYHIPLIYLSVYILNMLGRPHHFRSVSRSFFTFKKHLSHFRVIEHTTRCQNIRGRPGAVKAGHENELRLAVKQYIPTDNPSPKEGDVTIIGAHANAFPKVLHPSYIIVFVPN